MRDALTDSLRTALVDAKHTSAEDYRPALLINDPPHTKFVGTLVRELERCISFSFSVAFLTSGGVAAILQALYDAQERGVKGRILTSDYLTFTDPRALRFLTEYLSSSIEVRISSHRAFHAKGYLFDHTGGYTTLLVGSSNLTQEALSTNREWNMRLISSQEGELAKYTAMVFEEEWEDATLITDAWLEHYAALHRNLHQSRHWEPLPLPEQPVARRTIRLKEAFSPNEMQKEALNRLARLRRDGGEKALVVSATGTGKTLLAVLDVERLKPKRLLYIVHRTQIAREAKEVFSKTLSWDLESGLLGGGVNESDAPYLFATVATLSKDDVLYSFPRNWFDYIIIDEAHRSRAPTYRKVLDYFTPSFLLGMTATPYRSDGQDIFSLFDYSLACEITLSQAMNADLVVPFHYYGITALSVDGQSLGEYRDFSRLERLERTKRIVQMIRRYSIGITRPRGLIFVSRVQEAKLLATDLNELGILTGVVTGEDSPRRVEESLRALEKEDGLSYLVAVNILNEGVDIPTLNQIIMLRPTESAIIFTQQLGRGLRKADEKEYLTVIDFIGNWNNNYLIPIALFGDGSYRKDTLRKLMRSGSAAISGASTVSFDLIAKQQIFDAIDRASFSKMSLLKEEYEWVERRLGRVPTMVDFLALGGISPLLFIESKGSYLNFLIAMGRVNSGAVTALHLMSLALLGSITAEGKRIQEIHLLALVLERGSITTEEYSASCEMVYGCIPSKRSIDSAIRILTNGFFVGAARLRYGNVSYLVIQDGRIKRSDQFNDLLANDLYRHELSDLLEVGRLHFLHEYQIDRREDDLVIGQKYSRRDICRLLGWERDETSTLYGYKVHYELNLCPILVNYHKDEERINPLNLYRDKFLSPELLVWESRPNRTLDSKEIKAIGQPHIKKLLFVKKSDDEGRDHYFLGEMETLRVAPTSKYDESGTRHSYMMMLFRLTQPVEDGLYRYIIEADEQQKGAFQPA